MWYLWLKMFAKKVKKQLTRTEVFFYMCVDLTLHYLLATPFCIIVRKHGCTPNITPFKDLKI